MHNAQVMKLQSSHRIWCQVWLFSVWCLFIHRICKFTSVLDFFLFLLQLNTNFLKVYRTRKTYMWSKQWVFFPPPELVPQAFQGEKGDGQLLFSKLKKHRGCKSYKEACFGPFYQESHTHQVKMFNSKINKWPKNNELKSCCNKTRKSSSEVMKRRAAALNRNARRSVKHSKLQTNKKV